MSITVNGNGNSKANGNVSRVAKPQQGIYLAKAKERFEELDRVSELLRYHDDNPLISASKSLMCVHYLMRYSENDMSNVFAIGLSKVIADAADTINRLFELQADHEAEGKSGPCRYACGT